MFDIFDTVTNHDFDNIVDNILFTNITKKWNNWLQPISNT